MSHRKFLVLLVLGAFSVACSTLPSQGGKNTRLLFVGNSLTYVGNLPTVFTSLCKASKTRCSAEMVVEAGATLQQRIDDHTLSEAARTQHFDYLILQERGGDYIAPPGRVKDRRQAESAAETMVREALQSGMKPVLLGTYQDDPRASTALVAAEAALAAKLDVPHIAVSNVFACGKREESALRWLDADGGHPGPDLTMLMAVLLYRQIFGEPPAARPVSVHAPIYGPMNSPRAAAFASTQSVAPEIVRTVTYDIATMNTLMKLSQESCQ